MKYDFGGYATKNDLLCSDGRKIRRNAFEHQDGARVPLVYMHNRKSLDNVIGFADLENRAEGVYAYGKFNEDTPSGRKAKALVEHGDISCLSIFANDLIQNGNDVQHGTIREVSLVLAGANPGAVIDNLVIEHSDEDYEIMEDQATICCGEELNMDDIVHGDDDSDEVIKHADDSEETVEDVINTMTDKQKQALYYLVGAAAMGKSDGAEHSNEDDEEESDEDSEELEHDESEGNDSMKKSVFDKTESDVKQTASLTHDQFAEIVRDARKLGSFKESFLEHAQSYGIENIDILFPDAKTVTNPPTFIKRDTEWVADVLANTHHVPFSRIKSTAADITADEARARGYTKGNLKKEEVISLLKRVTTPTTVYKKQKLDRDDIIDITDLNVVSWLKSEMRMMLNEELARAFLIGDGRDAESTDKINEENIRPIWKDDDMYSHHIQLESDTDVPGMIESVIRARKNYRGSGSPTLYTTADTLVDMLLLTDKIGRRLYNNESELAAALRVKKIVEVPVMENQSRTVDKTTVDLVGIIVNLRDYTVGADKGGEVSMFDDFDIDYNQYKYLMETRCSATLVQPKSALVIEKKRATTPPTGGASGTGGNG